jgi:hypothetical protein
LSTIELVVLQSEARITVGVTAESKGKVAVETGPQVILAVALQTTMGTVPGTVPMVVPGM